MTDPNLDLGLEAIRADPCHYTQKMSEEATSFPIVFDVHDLGTSVTFKSVQTIYSDPLVSITQTRILNSLSHETTTLKELRSKTVCLLEAQDRTTRESRTRNRPLVLGHFYVAWVAKGDPNYTILPYGDDEKVRELLKMVAQRGFRDVIHTHFSSK
ncbi:uncharacterized protein RSE6_04161 [Rhynchosporium secalis]|uniref:Uncharacterized protein n=1 Tax=Rhynchosporium secalis TaxID=38038 RepID=A0A1E1M4K9_RHYSE|nr:uncharacterized protein RSE6_04161 [Rhynchosporium secalis]